MSSPQDVIELENWISDKKKQHWKVLKQLRTYVFPPFFTFEMKTSQLGSGENFNRIRFLVLKVCFSKKLFASLRCKIFIEIRCRCDSYAVFTCLFQQSKAFGSFRKLVSLSFSQKIRKAIYVMQTALKLAMHSNQFYLAFV